MLKIGLVGYSGRVGQLIAQHLDKEFMLSSLFVREGANLSSPPQNALITNVWQDFLSACEVVIDFSTPQATQALLQEVLSNPKPLVIGTTGLDCNQMQLLEQVSKTTPIVYATNTSQGVALLNKLAYLASRILKEGDIEISEIHHRNKKDAPSGTAMTLAQVCAKARGLDLESMRVSGRDGNIGARKDNEIGVMSFRGGDIVGRHTVGFYCDGEYLEITHNATNRATFAKGALRASQWVVSQKAGLYNMSDVLGI